MKKTTVVIICFLLTFINCKAQPNGGFENWTSFFAVEEPVGWQTINFLHAYSASNPLSAFKVSGIDAHSGTYALKIKTVFLSDKPPIQDVNDSTGGAYTGKINYNPPSDQRGFPYTNRPLKLEFWAKYIPVGNDSGKAGVFLKRWNGSDLDTIGGGQIIIPPTPDYTLFQIDLIYTSPGLPDSALIGFITSKSIATARVNSTLYVDDVKFIDAVGIDERTVSDLVNIYPNPAHDNVSINTKMDDADKIQLMDVSGKQAGIYYLQNYHVNINTSLWAAGVYFYNFLDKKDKVLGTGKFSVVK